MSTSPNHDYTSAQTVLRNADHPIKIAILEISTRACKLLIADIRELQQGFTWDGFRSEGNLTNLGLYAEEDGSIAWETFSNSVLPHLKRHLARLRNHNIDHVYTIATAALRHAQNSEEILTRLHSELGLHVQVLTQHQEGIAAAAAYQWNAPNQLVNNLLLIDQGGGSTEVLGFDAALEPIHFSNNPNLQMGTSSAIQWIKEHVSQHSLSEAMNRFREAFQILLVDKVEAIQAHSSFSLVGMGSGLTQATHKKGNQHQHGIALSQQQLHDEYLDSVKKLSDSFGNFEAVERHVQSLEPNSSEHQRLFDLLTKLVGCSMFDQLLSSLQVSSITVNGLGLRYGVCQQIIKAYYPDLVQGKHQLQLQQHSMSIDGIKEGSYTIGKVVGIAEFGAFVALPNEHMGLLHKSEVSSARLRALRGRPIRVKVRNIFTDSNGKQCFDLKL